MRLWIDHSKKRISESSPSHINCQIMLPHVLAIIACSLASAHVKIQYNKGFLPGQFRFLIDRPNGALRARRIHGPITLQNTAPVPKSPTAVWQLQQQLQQPKHPQQQEPRMNQDISNNTQKENLAIGLQSDFRFNVRWQEKCPTYPHPPRIPANIPISMANAHNILPSNACGLGGKATYYTEWNSNPGSCGYIPQHDNLVAVAPQLMPNACGRCILIRCNGKTVKAVVTDTCMACAANTKWIDMSHHLFGRFDNLSRGVLPVDWDFVQC